MPTNAELEAAMADPDFDPTDFLFGPEPEPEPAAFLLEPPPPPQPPKKKSLTTSRRTIRSAR